MKTNRWIEFSQRVYLHLLRLYPQVYREAYKLEMFCLFTDQCRDAYKERGKSGILALWPRTLLDVGITATREHLADPQAKLGLLEGRPNAPLPWKGVLLVLIPGLIFFISQIVQLTSNKDWFFLVYYRAAYFLILPVLLVWLLTRRFPIWGLIPFGLLYKLLGSYNPSYLISKLPLLNSPKSVIFFNSAFDLGYLIPVSICAVLLCGLIWYYARRNQISRNAWGLLGLYSLLIVLEIAGGVYRDTVWQSQYTDLYSTSLKEVFFQTTLWCLYDSLPFLLLVFIGTLFAHKYGGLSFLLLLGYLIPTIIFGRYGEWTDVLPFYLVSAAVLIYRFVVTLVAPIWLVRAASLPNRQRAAAIPVAIALVSQIVLSMIVVSASAAQGSYQLSALDFALTIWSQLIIAAGLGLAVSLYLPKVQVATSSISAGTTS